MLKQVQHDGKHVIRPVTGSDSDALWVILEPVVRAGETLAMARDRRQDEALAIWLGEDRETFVLEEEGRIAGAFYIRANQAGGGGHVANAGYVTAAHAGGRRSGLSMRW